MDDEQYIQTQNQLAILMSLIYGLDLKGYLARIERAEAFGPILNPTLYRQKGKDMQFDKEIADAFLNLQIVIRQQMDSAKDEA